MSKSLSKRLTLATVFLFTLLAAPAAQAQYMVIEGSSLGSNTNFDSRINSELTNRSLYVQDYNSVGGVSNFESGGGNSLSSTDILNGMFDGYIGVFGACIGLPAIMIAVLRLFVSKQTVPAKRKNKSFELPATPEPARYLKPAQVFLNPVQ